MKTKVLMVTFWTGLILLLFLSVNTGPQALTVRAAVTRRITKVSINLQVPPRATVDLHVPFHRQEHALSCEIAALRSALLTKGVDVKESELLSKLSFDPTPKKNGVWGDPNKGFVGDINGSMPSTGYGVYSQPIANLASHYRPAQAFTGGNLQTLITQLNLGNPIVIWVYVGTGKVITWKTPDGKTIRAVLSEHARTVTGYSGPGNKPTGIYTMDPIYGRLYQTTSSFMANWSALGYSGVIIR